MKVCAQPEYSLSLVKRTDTVANSVVPESIWFLIEIGKGLNSVLMPLSGGDASTYRRHRLLRGRTEDFILTSGRSSHTNFIGLSTDMTLDERHHSLMIFSVVAQSLNTRFVRSSHITIIFRQSDMIEAFSRLSCIILLMV